MTNIGILDYEGKNNNPLNNKVNNLDVVNNLDISLSHIQDTTSLTSIVCSKCNTPITSINDNLPIDEIVHDDIIVPNENIIEKMDHSRQGNG